MKNSNLNITVPKEIINKAIGKGISECEELAINVGADFGFEIFDLIKKDFEFLTHDLTIMGIFIYIFQNEEHLYRDIQRIGGGIVNVRLVTYPIISAILDINPKVMQTCWDEIHKEFNKI